MSKIDHLLKELCPDGVEWKALEEVASYSRDRVLSSTIDSNSYVGVESLLQNKKGKTSSKYVPTAGNLTGFVEDDILIGNIRPYLKKIWKADMAGGTNGDVLVVRIREENRNELLASYLYYLLSADKFFDFNMQFSKGAKMPRGDKDSILKYQIPIPPLPIQEEIVKILDRFTALEAELEAELEARSAQYEYYRNKLLSFEGGGVEWKTLGEVGAFTRGKRFVRTDIQEEGFPCIHYGEMYTHYHVFATKSKSFLAPDLASRLRVANPGDVVIVAAGETIEDIGKGTAWLGETDVVIHDACFSFKSELNPKYVSYFLRTRIFHDQIKRHISSGKISSIHSSGLGKARIPVPSFEEQERIVRILDQFDALVNDISKGLPAEIAARRQQYEYYRNRLLTFKQQEQYAELP